jgi:ACR3 family arsenite efflux pump ArsB
MIGALLLTLVLIFAFQAENLTTRWVAVLLIAVPILIQVYFNSGLAYLLMRAFKVPHNVASPGALIGASNSSSWPSRWPSRSSVPAPARRWRPSWACWSKCR